MRSQLSSLLVGLLSSVGCLPICSGQATYRVDFRATWSAETHPDAFPGNAHFSPLIGATHDDSVHFWERGEVASPGMEQMAETGATSLLRSEITAALGPTEFLSAPTLFSPNTTSIEFSVHADAPLVTLVSMIAPSPDWFVGISGLSLRSGGGFWRSSVDIPLIPLDAGTDSGSDFTSLNQDTQPQELIEYVMGHPLLPPSRGQPLTVGTFEFTLVDVPEPGGAILLLLGSVVAATRRHRWRPQ